MDRLVVPTAAVVCAALAGCGDERQGPAAPAPPAQRLDLGVVGVSARVGGEEQLGSGFVVDADRGLVATTAHAVWGARSLKLATGFGVLHGRIVARAPCDDLALLEVHPRIPGLAALASAPAGSPAGDGLLRSVGRRAAGVGSGLATIPVRADSAGRLDSPLVPEVSGGPVVDAAGRLVGMARAELAGAPATAVRWARIKARMGELRPGPRRVFVGWAEQYRCVSRQHARARAAHPGFRPEDARLNAAVAPTRLPGTESVDP
ncbi:trypsin-like peptidase domain-containing protein [Solirubrobacter sp. CPCC 204708]|uniref:Serine protease n=1 Tax=Solirubrobacter deserti TaxID=2282478 RepID=A0ABT4RF86_9ACTN|nr:serine protease [Solirubrobacter deserti]MBE2319518.1 trypsin-like peptidase domain-containing protein [Solirubrobacter deserti]MDA0137195.1 serine protease [Solirubrobacter deserti]